MPPASLLRPPELPPFELRELIPRVFEPPVPIPGPSSPPASTTTSDDAPASVSVGSRLSSLVRTSASPSAGDSKGKAKAVVARSVDGSADKVWVGTSDGRARAFELRPRARRRRTPSVADEGDGRESPLLSPTRRSVTSPSSHSSASRKRRTNEEAKVEVDAECVSERQIVPVGDGGKLKAVERLVLVPKVGKAIVLSEGVVTIHALPSLTPLPTSAFPPIRGVSAFAVDEDDVAAGQGDEATVCVIRRRSIHLFRLRSGGMGQVRDVALASAAFHGVLRGQALLLADIDQYSVVSLAASSMTPLLPISQIPPSDPNSSTGRATPVHRPAMAALPGTDEFLFASHTGQTCLGVFVNAKGEPSRGTIEWPSNPRSLVVVDGHALALLANGTVEAHSLATGEIAQVIALPEGLDARSVASVPAGVTIPGARAIWKAKTVSIPLYPAHRRDPTEPPRTPTPRSFHLRVGSDSSALEDLAEDEPTTARALLLGKDSVHALAPLTLVAQAEALISKNRWADAVALARSATAVAVGAGAVAGKAGDIPSTETQARYVLQKAAVHELAECQFEQAGRLWLEGGGDPRILVRLLPALKAGGVARRDDVDVFRGLEKALRDGPMTTADQLVTANLTRNYSPHVRPDAEAAGGLRSSLLRQAQAMVRTFLIAWRETRLATRSEDESRKVDMVVDTALAELYAEREPDALRALLEGPNDCVLAELDRALEKHRRYGVLTEVYARRGQMDQVLLAWKRLVDGQWVDPEFSGGIEKIVAHLKATDDVAVLSENAVWLARHRPDSALEVLRTAKASAKLDARATFDALRIVDEAAAEAYLVQVVGRKPTTDQALLSELITRWLASLKASLQNPDVAAAMRAFAASYAGAGRPARESFFVAMRDALSSSPDDAAVDRAFRTRLKLIVFLPSAKPAALADVRREFEGMGGNEAAFAFERALVYGKLRLHRPALALLASTLGDFASAEIYCVQDGNVVTRADAAAAAKAMGLELSFLEPPPKRRKPVIPVPSTTKAELLAILFELGMAADDDDDDDDDDQGGKPASSVAPLMMTGLLQRHAVHLPIARLLPSLDGAWPLDPTLTTYVVRSLRRSEHERQEANLVKGVTMGQEMEWELKLAAARTAAGPFVQTEGEVPREGAKVTVEQAKKALDEIVEQKLGDVDDDGLL